MTKVNSVAKTGIQKGISRRSLLKNSAAVAGLALAASACVPAGPEAAGDEGMAASQEPVDIQIWWRINPTTEGVLQVFQEQHPDITVSLGDLGEAVYGTPKYVTAVAAGKGPDVSYQNRHTFRQFASRNLYRPIEDLLERDNVDKGNFMAGPIADLTWQGTLYGLPHTAGTRYFFWNRTHFEEAGLDPDVGPETWDDIMEMAPQLNKMEGDRIVRYGFLPHFPPGLSDQLLIYAMENGGVSQSEDGRTNLINTDPWVEALEWCVHMIDEFGGGNAAASSFMEGFAGQPVDPFAQGQVSMSSYGNWMIGRYARFPDLDYDGTGLMPVSASQEGAQVNWSCGWTFVIDPNTELVEQGWEFIQWVISEEYVRAAGTVGLALEKAEWERQQLPGEPIFAPTPPVYQPAMQVMLDEYYSVLPERQKIMMERYLDSETFAVGCGQIAGLAAAELWIGFKNAWEAALTKKLTPQEALDASHADVQKALDAAWENLEYS